MTVRLPLSTWGLGEALRRALAAGVPAPQVIHFNNCFNLSLELMHTVSPYAGYATAYGNYNFFTAGETYPAVFEALFKHPLTESGLQQFLSDWAKTGQSIL
jgi:hypothetical protein